MQRIKLSRTEKVKGANWGIYGVMKVGKSYLTKLLALNYYQHGKRIIILDHNFNDETYDSFWGIQPLILTLEQFISIDWEMMPDSLIVRVQKANTLVSFDFNKFFACCSTIRYSVFIFDDLLDLFGSNASSAIKNFPATVINNHNEAFYQFHTLYQAHPFLRQKLQNIVLKSLPVDVDIPNDFMLPGRYIRICLSEIEQINSGLPFKKKFAWRILHADDGLITLPVHVMINGRPEQTATYLVSEYFKNK